ncbi:MAG: hypothetical protein PSN04_06305, partial [Methyloprofundus sp.]|nr:hypothetical protein [Methyloprofundus sp.]
GKTGGNMEKIDISSSDHLTQKDIVQLLLHNAQHMVTREEVKQDISKVEDRISVVEMSLKQEILKVEASLKQDISKVEGRISAVEASLKQDISKVEGRISAVEVSLKQDISKVDAKFDKIQWLIIATIVSVFLKDYIIALIQ